MKQGIYRLNIDFRRGGNLTGLFLATKQEVDILVKHEIEVYFGEVNGKHSEIYGAINEDQISLVTDDPDAVECFRKYTLQSGHDPFTHDTTQKEWDKYGLNECSTVQDAVDKIIENENR